MLESNMRSNEVLEGVASTLAQAGAALAGLVEAVQTGALRTEGQAELSALLREVRGLQARLEYVGLASCGRSMCAGPSSRTVR
jgi:hypothetical protein